MGATETGEEESNMVKRWRKEERGVKMPKYRKKPVIIEAVTWDGSQESAQEINQFPPPMLKTGGLDNTLGDSE